MEELLPHPTGLQSLLKMWQQRRGKASSLSWLRDPDHSGFWPWAPFLQIRTFLIVWGGRWQVGSSPILVCYQNGGPFRAKTLSLILAPLKPRDLINTY